MVGIHFGNGLQVLMLLMMKNNGMGNSVGTCNSSQLVIITKQNSTCVSKSQEEGRDIHKGGLYQQFLLLPFSTPHCGQKTLKNSSPSAKKSLS